MGEVTTYNNNLQLNIKQLRKAHEDEYILADYMPTSDRDVEEMYKDLLNFVDMIRNPYLKQSVEYYFVKDEEFIRKFKNQLRGQERSPRLLRRAVGAHGQYFESLPLLCGGV